MKSIIFVFLVLSCTFSAVHSGVICNETLSGDINDEVSIKGTSCVLSGARVNGLVKVSDGGSLKVESGSTINGGLELQSADFLYIDGRESSVTLNGGIKDENSTGTVIVLGNVVINGDIHIMNRIGNIELFPVTVYGSIKFSDGSGFSRIEGISGNPREIIVHDRGAGMTIVSDTAPTSKVDIRGSGFVRLSGTTVYDSASLVSNGLDGNAVLIYDVNVYNTVLVEGSGGVTVVNGLTVSNRATFNRNTGGIYCTESNFNFLGCEENADPIEFTNTTISTGEGQCSAV